MRLIRSLAVLCVVLCSSTALAQRGLGLQLTAGGSASFDLSTQPSIPYPGVSFALTADSWLTDRFAFSGELRATGLAVLDVPSGALIGFTAGPRYDLAPWLFSRGLVGLGAYAAFCHGDFCGSSGPTVSLVPTFSLELGGYPLQTHNFVVLGRMMLMTATPRQGALLTPSVNVGYEF